MFALAALLMTGCSSEEVTPNGGDVTGGNGEAETRYMAVNLMSSDVTRAMDGYEDGSEAENQVTKVRFYFFDENGDAAEVKLDGAKYVNYYDWTPESQKKDENGNDDVEKKLEATIVINTASGDKLPQQIAAVLNPTSTLGSVSKDLSELKAVFANYAASNRTMTGTFVMFNSVFGKNNAEFCAVPIMAENLQKSENAAKANPVTIYVERSVAKVEVTTSVKLDENNRMQLKDKDDHPILVDGKNVYLQLNGWSLTAETSNGRLVKKIDPTWTSVWWNKFSQFRSVWAINSPSATNNYYDYFAINGSFDVAKYTNENAAPIKQSEAIEGVTPAANHTKVILSGTLCDEDGNAFTIVRHMGAYFADSEDDTEDTPKFNNLKKSILAQLNAGNHTYYYDSKEVVNGETETVRKQIDVEDIEIVYAAQKATENSKNNCYVYAELSETGKGKTWYALTEEGAVAPLTVQEVNDGLKKKENVDWALVWKSGMTYYYYEIIHNQVTETNNDGESNTVTTYGVVRNHVYRTNITKIAGLGTPVYDPKQTIYPEKPDPNDHYIAAEIKILSWRIVKNDYKLEW